MATWHFLHLVARILEALLGVFCVATAILLYPSEDGKIQSALEDFWVRVDDYQRLALARHAVFMTQVAQFETRFLDRIFGRKLISGKALRVSLCCSWGSLSVLSIVHLTKRGANPQDFFFLTVAGGLLCLSLMMFDWSRLISSHGVKMIFVMYLCLFMFGGIVYGLVYIENKVYGYYFTDFTGTDADKLAFLFSIGFGGFVCDAVFIAVTRRLLRWAGQMNSLSEVAWLVFLNIVLSLVLIGPALYAHRYYSLGQPRYSVRLTVETISLTNAFDVGLAMLFVFLVAMLLIHRLFWPLLTRTLFRTQEIGTNGRRGILTAIGVAFLSASVFHENFPELLKELFKGFGG